ncbi:ABC transporter ATP-binding protein [Pedobacter nutrimenti]|jgi:ABC-type multidrug transport system ATPase subunit|uniref:ABC-type multidrug transport system ATPase subunit n=1 Tax=Pedobacter nutrimenti TaxID=1241337 RepID=A0A318UKW8_9SPHI|nr:ABC transporter ATP-binding protein [Pedobacter nutrimenti]PYF76551.1 ABC-type multidrug transport system ATPase subunit [Pedobacter nutrimenti]
MERLKICGLTKSYGNGVKALDNVSLCISNGLFGLLGPNGAGKSSLMRTLATLQLADSGEIYFDGCDIGQHPQTLREQLGYLPQDFGVYPKISALSLLDHLAVLKGLTHKSERREQVHALLQQTNLYQVRKQAVSTFSGGMRQRFGIAQALLGNPQLLIADEPTAGLDPEERNRFHDLLNEIAAHKVVLLSTHIVEDVLDLCEEMAVLAGGKIILQGKPTELTRQLKGQVWLKAIAKEEFEAYTASFRVIATRSKAGKILLHVLSEHCPGPGFEALEPSLEHVYFSALAAGTFKEGQLC